VTAGMGALASLAFATAALTGCGGGGERKGSSPEAVARAFVSTNDASKCDLVTPELLERQTGRRGADARRFCATNVIREPVPKSVRVIEAGREGEKEGHEEGDKADVELLVDNREERVELTRRDGRWRISATGR
jgi:hypothetical protein